MTTTRTTGSVDDWMAADVVTVAPDDELRTARRLLRDHGLRHLPVVERGRVVGMISDRDVRLDLEPESATDAQLLERVRERRTVEAVMSDEPWTVTEGTPLVEAARLMLSRRISGVPVVGSDMELVGIVTTTDCLLALLEQGS